METKRLKNIAILILILLNAFLLLLLGYQDLLGRRANHETLDELTSLFATEKLKLEVDVDDLESGLSPLTLVRKAESEGSIASFLLGGAVPVQSEGGGIYSYTNSVGVIRFRSGGGFDTVRLRRFVENPEEFVRKFCTKFGYSDIKGELTHGSGTVTAMQCVARVPILDCGITMVFEDGYLLSVSGAHIDLGDADMEREVPLSSVTILMRFFDYRREMGIVCSAIYDIQCVYQLRNIKNLPRLMPVWIIETDTYTYMMDGITGEVL